MVTIERVATPDRSLGQRMAALQRANEVRSYRRNLKQELKECERSPAEVLQDVGPEVATMKVFDLLVATPKFGRVKATKMLSRARISPSKTLAGLSERQRRELVASIAPYARGRRPRSVV